MQSLLDLYLVVDRFAIQLPKLNLDGEDQEEYSTVLLQLQNQVEGGTPNPKVVEKCLSSLEQFTKQALRIQGAA